MRTGSENKLTREQADREANNFAMCLLMPEDILRSEIAKVAPLDLCDEKAIKKLADKFGVPLTVMAIRIGQLGY